MVLKKSPVAKATAKPRAVATKSSARKIAPKKAVAAAKNTKKKIDKDAAKTPNTTSTNRKRKQQDIDIDSVGEDASTRKVQKAPAPKRAKKSLTKKGPVINRALPQILEVFPVGETSEGVLGLGPDVKRAKRPQLTPHMSPETVGVVQIAVGGMHALAMTHDSKIYSWGVNDTGALGHETHWEGSLADADASDSDSDNVPSNPLELTPTAISSKQLPGDVVFTQVTAGDSTSSAITDDGRVYGWDTSRDSEGKTGFMVDAKHRLFHQQLTPILIPSLKNITQIACGADHVRAVDSTGKVFA